MSILPENYKKRVEAMKEEPGRLSHGGDQCCDAEDLYSELDDWLQAEEEIRRVQEEAVDKR